MTLQPVFTRTSELIFELTRVWEQSVRTTHDFLSDEEIDQIKKYVPDAFRSVPSLTVAIDDSGSICGFIGTSDKRIEMLFIAPDVRGKGIGKQLLTHVVNNESVDEVTVNEQNPQAVGFYEHMGFSTYKRSPVDEQGAPYPILHMRLTKP